MKDKEKDGFLKFYTALNNLKNHNLSVEDYLQYVTLLKMQKNMLKLNLSADALENKIYLSKNKPLTEKEKILYEYHHIMSYIKKNRDKIFNFPKEETDIIFSYIESLLEKINNLNSYDSIIKAKKIITKIQVKLGLDLTFYTVVENLMLEIIEGKDKVK